MIVGDKKTREKILPVLAIGLSALTLSLSNDLSNIPSIAVSLIGIIAGIIYFLGARFSLLLLQIWIWAQVPSISRSISTYSGGIKWNIEQPYWVTGQTATITAGLTLGSSNGTWHIKANLVPFGLLLLFRFLQVSSLVGATVQIRKLGTQGSDGVYSGTILEPVTLGKEKHWLLVRLASEIVHDGSKYSHLLIKPKDDDVYSSKASKVVSFLLLVSDPIKLQDGLNRKQEFPFLEWGYVSFV